MSDYKDGREVPVKTIQFGEMQSPNTWANSGTVIRVGDVFTQEWMDRVRDLMRACNEKDAEIRYWKARSLPAEPILNVTRASGRN